MTSRSPFQKRLPRELIQEIFSHLHPKYVLQYSRLCCWIHNCLRDPRFPFLNLSKFPQTTHDFDRLYFQWPKSYQIVYARTKQESLRRLQNVVGEGGTLQLATDPYTCHWVLLWSEAVPLSPTINLWTQLTHLQLQNPRFLGSIPETLGTMTNLLSLSLTGFTILAPFPVFVCNLKNLKSLSLPKCSLTGAIPPEIGDLGHLTILNLANNLMAGKLPESVSQCRALKHVDLHRNRFYGPVAPLLSLTHLNHLDVSTNRFSGEISGEIGRMRWLEVLQIQSNRFSGPWPAEIEQCTGLLQIYWKGSRVEEDIPSTIARNSRIFSALEADMYSTDEVNY
ncbi:L domain-like protein [Rhizoclosmatium globosum]|uniref:L domain-like protein n=1 Tax=Rhizoclosmatium globosum TaxID=329046 RepID=A0A1Y2CBL4_9FUNG|nr:L domain-like protein [Rhizoclosmatium globosum]|eukprot:ORY44326.1 L domain-like protein [Rhizoclosmatium globosum]